MIHVDLTELRKVWYNFGLNNSPISGEKALVFNSLDRWQKRELLNEYVKGTNEADKTIA